MACTHQASSSTVSCWCEADKRRQSTANQNRLGWVADWLWHGSARPGVSWSRWVTLAGTKALESPAAAVSSRLHSLSRAPSKEHLGMTPLSRKQMAWRAAQDLKDGTYVNLGIGLPTLVADYIPTDREIVFHSENGI